MGTAAAETASAQQRRTAETASATAAQHASTPQGPKMSLADDVDLEQFVMSKDELSGADIKAICTEAGLLALRERRMRVTMDDFTKAKDKALYRKKGNIPSGLYL